MHKGRFVWQSIIVWMCFVAPVYGKVRGFEEISQKKYEQDVWHTYAHKKSGLEVIWIENDDVNKAFTIGVKTPTTNDTGVNHIIEHTVFTGSKAYPSPSVFFDASEAYPNTYMNALTSGDMTIFPFSTPYLSCYQKLCPIYLDAVFRPQFLETPYGFYEESFHVVPEEGRCGGVVYNEMKGAYGNADRGLYRALRQTIYANTPYAFDSGGAPNDIPTLTYETFIETYKQYYYPGNMKIILYGDLPVEEVLEQILPYVEKQEKKEGVSLKVNQLHDTASFEYAVLEDQDKGVLIKAFALNDGVGAEALQTLDLWMSAYLMSPKMYLESKLRETGIQIRWLRDTDLPQPIYALAAVNIPLDKMEETSKKIDEVIEEALKLGGRNVFLEQDILKEAKWVMHKQEKSNNRGIHIAQSILDGWAHDREENQYYLTQQALNQMKKLDGNKARKLLKEARYYTISLMPGHYEIQSPEALSPVKTESWNEIYKAMQEWQNQKSALKAIDLNEMILTPRIVPSAIRKKDYWELETRVETEQARSTLYFNTSHISQDQLPYMYLYSYLLEESAAVITPFSGILETQCTAYPLKEGYWPCFKISIMTPKEEKQHAILLSEARLYLMNQSEKWYQQKLMELTLAMKSESQTNAIGTLAQLTLAQGDCRGRYLYEQTYPFYSFCKTLLKQKEKNWIKEVKQIDSCLYHKGGTILATAVPKQGKNIYARQLGKFIESLPNEPNLKGQYKFKEVQANHMVYNESEVDYCYMRLNKKEGIEGSDYLMAAYLTKHYLNPQLRVKMGAYGTGCQVNDLVTMGIYTYRDPDYRNSLEIINKSGQCLEEAIDEALLYLSKAEALGKVHTQYRLLDSPMEQSVVMEHLMLWGKTPNEVVRLQKEVILSSPSTIQLKQKAYEKTIREGKIAVMTKKNCSEGQNFTIYQY